MKQILYYQILYFHTLSYLTCVQTCEVNVVPNIIDGELKLRKVKCLSQGCIGRQWWKRHDFHYYLEVQWPQDQVRRASQLGLPFTIGVLFLVKRGEIIAHGPPIAPESCPLVEMACMWNDLLESVRTTMYLFTYYNGSGTPCVLQLLLFCHLTSPFALLLPSFPSLVTLAHWWLLEPSSSCGFYLCLFTVFSLSSCWKLPLI